MRRIYMYSLVAGALMGVFSGITVLNRTWWALLPWGFLNLLVGHFSGNYWEGRRAGALYGFALTVTFLLAGFKGSFAQLPGFIFLLAVAALIGTAGGAAFAMIAIYLGELYSRRIMK